MQIRVLETTSVDVAEADVQKAIETNLECIEDGLLYVGSFVPIGTGIVDTLALDDESNAVIIEYKKPGDFLQGALLQLMNYYGWFAQTRIINYT